MISPYHEQVAAHYETYPYPSYPFFMNGRWSQLASVDTSRWGALHKIEDIWVAGAGTIAPLMFGRRNFSCRVLATDLSEKSLAVAKRRLRIFGIRNVILRVEDVLESSHPASFDAIDAYGVIHHTFSPERALANLSKSLRPGGVLRLMVYSKHARAEIEDLRREAVQKKLKSVAEVQELIRGKRIDLSGDLKNSVGIADAVLNPVVHVYDEASFRNLLSSSPELALLDLKSDGNYVAFLRKT